MKDFEPLINHSLIMQAHFTQRTTKHFWMPYLKIYSFAKNVPWKSSRLIHMAVRKLLRLSDGLANRSFYRSDISRIQLKSNWAVGEKLLALDQEVVRNWRLSLHKKKRNLLQCLISKLFICKNVSVMEFLACTHGSQGTALFVRWPWEPIILLIGHFEGPTEVQLNDWWKTVSLWSITVW